jgi:hypothetical protein
VIGAKDNLLSAERFCNTGEDPFMSQSRDVVKYIREIVTRLVAALSIRKAAIFQPRDTRFRWFFLRKTNA